MTNALSISPVACWLIELYQRWLSPLKGFRCAYRARHARRDSCSQYGKRAIAKLGLLAGLQLLRRRFDRCHVAAQQVLDYEPRRRTKKVNANAPLRRGCDCDPSAACDLGNACDIGTTCDLVPSDCGDAASCDLSI